MPATELRFVFDTNTLISAALFSNSLPGKALRVALVRGVLLASAETLTELAEVLGRRKLDRYLTWEERETFLQTFADRAEIITPGLKLAVCRDPDDDMLIELAIAGRANALVTGDADLLTLSAYDGIPILNAEGFLERFSVPAR